MSIYWTDIQRKRLVELDADANTLDRAFDDTDRRNRAFQTLEKGLVASHRRQLDALRSGCRRPRLCRLEDVLVEMLVSHGFVQVSTPMLMSRGLLGRMAITAEHPLFQQIYWVDKEKCLRPMLAPHLYYVIKDLLRLWEKPVRIFEVGTCFRKETEGARHAAEFTMLNLCEFGLPETERQQRLESFAALVMESAGIDGYRLETETSAVYGSTLDVVSDEDGLELGSGAMGPHPLDRAWRITDTWVGIGFGLERLLMTAAGGSTLSRFGRSISYLDGIRLNI
ncbi:pyrrolysine--tRNA(Pyl) ligase large subunit [uncultured Desulfosarcina sp.]|uniref:pyrrolysine--tRNA(Pyl) ligase large subunit n=1 Tax=uncultured Desulfosarcina sp. TaxID=218289 RepID=UPI0029C84482|nr:pyrrolysine--tRNA(Pyl) ligase large subunit [uncultured Desulfosarcina sp.]